MANRLGVVVEDDMLQSMLRDADADADNGGCPRLDRLATTTLLTFATFFAPGINFEEFKTILRHTGLFQEPANEVAIAMPTVNEDEEEANDDSDDADESERDDAPATAAAMPTTSPDAEVEQPTGEEEAASSPTNQ